MVDDLAVADDCVAAIDAEDRLMPAGDIDDAEAPHSKAEITVNQRIKIIRAPMGQPITLAGDNAAIDRLSAPSIPARNCAHRSCSGTCWIGAVRTTTNEFKHYEGSDFVPVT